MILVKSLVIFHPIRKFYIYWRIPCLHKFQINQKPSCSSVSIYKRVYSFKLYMKTSQLSYYMLLTFHKLLQQFFHFRLNHIRLYRLMLSPHYTNRHFSIYSSVILVTYKHKKMNLLDNTLTQWLILLYQFTYKLKGFLVSNRFHMVF